ncbi:MAG: hypothetical protein AB8H80_05535 [Planctomycetota bacterium]
MNWPTAFALTVLIELPLIVWLLGSGRRTRAAGDVLAANLLTHPLAWFLVRLQDWPWTLVELLVLAAEACAYRKLRRIPWRRAVLLSSVANGATAALSLLL